MGGQISWQILLPNFFHWFLTPLAALYFFCRFCGAPSKWPRGGWAGAVTALTLTGSVVNVCGGIARTLGFWIFSAAFLSPAMQCLDTVRELVRVLLAVLFLRLIEKHFRQDMSHLTWSAALPLTVPVLYISLVERTIRNTIYGDTIIVDSTLGLVHPSVDHLEMLVLQVFACICLVLTLAAYQKTAQAIQARQTIRLLRQQAQVQEDYIREAQSRYEQTRSFRHDVKNHLAVLAELLRTNQAEQACAYLSRLEGIAGELSFPVRTGRAAVDALLGSKLAAARRQEISVTCELRVPNGDGVTDIDWCIILSNASDNAIRACGEVPADRRFIEITGKMQGDFYLLSVRNSCADTLDAPPEEGIGIDNIRAAA